MSKSYNSNFLSMLANLQRNNARAVKMQTRGEIALLDYDAIASDDDFATSLEIREMQEREENAHERMR